MSDYENVNYDNDIFIPNNIINGRVNIINNKPISQKTNMTSTENNNNSVSRNITSTNVSVSFFSKDNIKLLQKTIINEVYNRSDEKFIITNQSEQELLVIMRSYYLQFAKNLPTNVYSQIQELNKMVIDWAVAEILTNIRQYMNYKKSVSALPMPLERAQLPSQKGTKNLELKSFI
jgi:hypothetical protein